MTLQSVLEQARADVRQVLSDRRLSQQEFCEKHDLSYSWLNKFLSRRDSNPRIQSVERLQEAISLERRRMNAAIAAEKRVG